MSGCDCAALEIETLNEQIYRLRMERDAANAVIETLTRALEEANAAVKAAVETEREACAQIADDHECGGDDDIICQHLNCASMICGHIRARSNAVKEG